MNEQSYPVLPFARRSLAYATLLAAVLLVGFLSGAVGLVRCSPPPLPGDEAWALQQHFWGALRLVEARDGGLRCFTADAFGVRAIRFGAATLWIVLAGAAVFFLLELFGPGIRRALLRARGGHTLVLADPRDVRGLLRHARKQGPVALLGADAEAALRIRSMFPFRLVENAGDGEGQAATRLAADRARAAVLASSDDLANAHLADEVVRIARAAPRPPKVEVRLENPLVRAVRGRSLLEDAAGKVPLQVFSLRQMQIRQGARLASPDRYEIGDSARVHLAVVGSGPLVEAIVLHLVRQGYGLARAKPRISVIATGERGAASLAGALAHAGEAAEIDVLTADPGRPAEFGAAVAQLALGPDRLRAVHCASERPGEPEALAEAFERAVVQLRRAPPLIVAYATATARAVAPGRTGMIHLVREAALPQARDLADVLDRQAIAIHENFLAKQRAARGGAFGREAAERPWSELPPQYQDDNRAAADNMEYQLRLAGYRLVPAEGRPSAAVSADAVEQLSADEHARWMAAKILDGWRYGSVRDNERLHHPSLIPYDALPESEKQKDRENVLLAPELAARAGLRIARVFECGFLDVPDEPLADLRPLLERLARWQAEHPAFRLTAVIAPGSPGAWALAEGLLEGPVPLVVVLDKAASDALADLGRAGPSNVAQILRAADAFRVPPAAATTGTYLAERCGGIISLRDGAERADIVEQRRGFWGADHVA